MRKHTQSVEQLRHVHPNAAGLDIGAREIWVCVPADRDAEWVRAFGTFTPDLQQLAEWLREGASARWRWRVRGVHGSPNVTKRVLDWEYARDVVRSELRAGLKDRLQPASADSSITEEGCVRQGQGGPAAQSVSAQKACGGEPDV